MEISKLLLNGIDILIFLAAFLIIMEISLENKYRPESLEFLLSRSCFTDVFLHSAEIETTQQGKVSEKDLSVALSLISRISTFENFSQKTTQLSLSYLTIFLMKKAINNGKIIEVIAFACMRLALKYEEGRELSLATIHNFSSCNFPLKAIHSTEVLLLKVLEWRLDQTTPSELQYFQSSSVEDLKLFESRPLNLKFKF